MSHNVEALLSVIEFKKQMTMIKTYDEISTQLERYEAEVEMKFNKKEKHLMCSFAEWIQPQLLQQTDCSTLRDSIVQKMKEVAEATPVHNDEFTEYERNLELEHLRIALQMIDELSPVA